MVQEDNCNEYSHLKKRENGSRIAATVPQASVPQNFLLKFWRPNVTRLPYLWVDADLSLQDLLLRFQIPIHVHTDYRGPEVLWGKRDRTPLSQEERASDCLGHSLKGGNTQSLALTSLYRFFRPLTSKKVLFYYTKVCFGWLSLQTQERCWLNTSKEDICNVKGEKVKWLCPIPRGFSPDFRKIKILSKHLLP